MTLKPIAFRCDPKTHARLRKLRKHLKRKTGRAHTYEMMINGLLDDRQRLVEAERRIADLERLLGRSPRKWSEMVEQQGERRIAALYGLVSLFKGVARYGDQERLTKMLDLHYAEMEDSPDTEELESWVCRMPERLESMNGELK